jgi:hypothetical protein
LPTAYDVHPEFGYLSPAPRVGREIRVAVVSILFGMVVGAAIVTIGAGHATDAVSRDAYLNSSASEPAPPGVAGPSSQLKTAENAKANPAEAIEPYPMRMVRVRSSKAPSPLAGIPLGRTAPPEPNIVPAPAGPASPENAEGPASPPASTPAQSVAATAEPPASRTKKRPSAVHATSAMHARRHQEDEDENARWQKRRWPYWGERAYAEDRHWRGAYRNWVY